MKKVEIIKKHFNDTFDDFEFRINNRINEMYNQNRHVYDVRIENIKENLICIIIFNI